MDSTKLKQIEQAEHDKYMRLHAQKYGSTGYQRHISEYVHWTAKPDDKILDMGCGRGVAVDYLLQEKRNVFGVDITLVGEKSLLYHSGVDPSAFSKRFIEAPLWALPFKDNEFDYTFSADVLEHIPPELVPDVIAEIYRITNKQTLHVVSTQPSSLEDGLHLTVKPVNWWRGMFNRRNVNGIKCLIVDCAEFLILHKKKEQEMVIEVKCTCRRVFDNKEKLARHLKIHKGDARHVPDLSHKNTKSIFGKTGN